MKFWTVLMLVVSLFGCTKQSGMSKSDVLAEVGGEKITWGEVEEDLTSQIAYLDQKYREGVYNTKLQHIERVVGERVLKKEASKQGLSIQALLEKETTASGTLSDQEVEKFYKDNLKFLKARFPKDKKKDLLEKIKQGLGSQRKAQAQQTYIENLKKSYDVKILLEAPRTEVSADDDPYLGAKSAKVTVIEFSDFTCPYCASAAKTVRRVMEDPKYQSQVKIVYRDSPTDRRPASFPAAMAAQCANDQDKFWVYHDLLFENQSSLNLTTIKKFAADIGLNMDKFNTCLDTKKYEKEVNKDLRDGFKAGISGTPTFFVNGRMAQIPPGDAGVAALKKLIDTELNK